MTRHFLADDDLRPAEQAEVLDLAVRREMAAVGMRVGESVVRDEPENRRHAQKAVLAWLLERP